MTLNQIIEIIEPISVIGPHRDPTGRLVDDSRSVQPGDVFIAIKGMESDGHKYVGKAVDSGATLVICEHHANQTSSENCTYLICKNTRLVLAPLAFAFAGNPERELIVTGVTGTNGKTTVSTLIWQILTDAGHKTALISTVDKKFGTRSVPSSLTTPGSIELAGDFKKATDTGCTHLVMEVSSHALDQYRTEGIDFSVAVFTNLTLDHLDYHHDLTSYAASKKRLFDGLSDEAIAITNIDDEHGLYMVQNTAAQVWEFGFDGIEYRIDSNDSNGLLIDMDGIYIESPLTGKFNAYNLAQSWLASIALGVSPRLASKSLKHATGAPGRLEKVLLPNRVNELTPIVFVDYAHTPNALENVLQTLIEIRSGSQKITVVFGCGGNRDRSKRPLMANIAGRYADHTIVTSDNPRFEDPDFIIDEVCTGFTIDQSFERVTDRTQAIRHAIFNSDPGQIVLIAGKGHENYQEIKGTRHPLDDKEICTTALIEWLDIHGVSHKIGRDK